MNQHWQTKKLGEICDILDNLRKPVTQRDRISGNYPYYGATGIQDYVSDYIFDEKLILIGEDGAKWGAGENTAFIAEGKYWVNNHAHVIRPHRDKVLDNWIVYFLNVNDLSNYITGLTVQKLNQGKLREIEIPLPPLSDQKLIVKKMDEVFEKMAKAKENAEKNLQNSKELFESYLQSVFTNMGDKWEEKEFGEIIELLTDYHANGSYQILKTNVDLKKSDDYAWMVRSTDFENNFENDKRYITEKSYNFLKKSKIFGDEIIISKIGNAGKVYLMPKIDRPCSLAMNLFLIRLNEQKCLSKYVYRYMNSKNGREQIKSRILGTTTKTITKDNVRSIKIPFPSLNNQQSIIVKLDALSTETKKLEAIYKQKLADLEELKKSVLQKAFAGEL